MPSTPNSLHDRLSLRYLIFRDQVLTMKWNIRCGARIRWVMICYRLLTWIARSRFSHQLKRMHEHHPILDMDIFGQQTLNEGNRGRYQRWQYELRDYLHRLSFPEHCPPGMRSRPYTGPLMAPIDWDCSLLAHTRKYPIRGAFCYKTQ